MAQESFGHRAQVGHRNARCVPRKAMQCHAVSRSSTIGATRNKYQTIDQFLRTPAT